MDNATVVASGTKIADEIGTNRSEVWRLVQQLRTLGVEIAGHPATGYRSGGGQYQLVDSTVAPILNISRKGLPKPGIRVYLHRW